MVGCPIPPSLWTLPERKAITVALDYGGIVHGKLTTGAKADWVFIGSGGNLRMSDLRDAP